MRTAIPRYSVGPWGRRVIEAPRAFDSTIWAHLVRGAALIVRLDGWADMAHVVSQLAEQAA